MRELLLEGAMKTIKRIIRPNKVDEVKMRWRDSVCRAITVTEVCARTEAEGA
jgi:nitrogen regulatory protein PII